MKIPQTIQDEMVKLEPAYTKLQSELQRAEQQLAALGFLYTPPPASIPAKAAIAVKNNINKIMLQSGIIIAIHPWTSGAGEFGNGRYTEQLTGYLSTNEAVEHLGNKLTDPEDAAKDSVNAVFCIVIESDNLTAWIYHLNILNSFYPFPGSLLCEKRASCLANIQNTKMQKKNAAYNPYWADYQITSEETADITKKLSDALIATVEGYALDENPINELITEITAEEKNIVEMEAKWQELINHIQNNEINAYYATGATPYTLAAEIKTKIPKDNSKYCCLIALAGKEENITFFKEAFEL